MGLLYNAKSALCSAESNGSQGGRNHDTKTQIRMKHEGHPSFPILQSPPITEPTAKDPVCGMDVVPSRAAGKYDYEGKTYYFCAVSCLKKFQQTPETYLDAKQRPSSIPTAVVHERRAHLPNASRNPPDGTWLVP